MTLETGYIIHEGTRAFSFEKRETLESREDALVMRLKNLIF